MIVAHEYETAVAPKQGREIETRFHRLVAREHTRDTDEAVLALANDPKYTEFFNRSGLPLGYLFPNSEAIAELQAKEGVEFYDIVLDDQASGGGVIADPPNEQNQRDISYWSNPDLAHKGKTVGAVSAVVGDLLERGYGVTASVRRGNRASMRILETIGQDPSHMVI